MSSPAMDEAIHRSSIDTVIGERPPSPKIESQIGQQARYEGVAPGNPETQSRFATPPAENFRSLRTENLTQDQRIEWEHIRAQLGLESDAEEGRVNWENMRDQLGLNDDDKNSVTLFKQLSQACLVLLTTPFMLMHGVFKMSGALCRCLGMIFSALAGLCSRLTYKPKKHKTNKIRQPTGQIQI